MQERVVDVGSPAAAGLLVAGAGGAGRPRLRRPRGRPGAGIRGLLGVSVEQRLTTTRGRALSAAAPGPPPRPEAEPRSPAARPLPHSLLPMPPVNFCATWHQALAARHNGAGVRGSGGGLALPRDPPGRPDPAAPGPTSDAAVPSGRLGPVPAALRRPTCAGALGGRGALLGPEGPETGAGARHEGAEADEELRAAARAAPSGCARGRERGRVRTRGCAGWRRAEGAGAPRARVGGGGSVGAPGRSLQARRPSSPGRAGPFLRLGGRRFGGGGIPPSGHRRDGMNGEHRHSAGWSGGRSLAPQLRLCSSERRAGTPVPRAAGRLPLCQRPAKR